MHTNTGTCSTGNGYVFAHTDFTVIICAVCAGNTDEKYDLPNRQIRPYLYMNSETPTYQ